MYTRKEAILKAATVTTKSPVITDRLKLVSLCMEMDVPFHQRAKSMIIADRRYSFNEAGEIVQIQEIIKFKKKAGYRYKLLACDPSVEGCDDDSDKE